MSVQRGIKKVTIVHSIHERELLFFSSGYLAGVYVVCTNRKVIKFKIEVDVQKEDWS